jgi:hypothetical protein
MRAYFIVAGLLAGLSNLSLVIRGRALVLVLAIGSIGLLLSIASIYIGATLPKLVSTASPWVPKFLIGTSAYLCLLVLIGAASGALSAIVQPVIGFLVVWYLLRNFRRLAREAAVVPTASERIA